MGDAAEVPDDLGLMLGQAGYLYIYYVFATWLPGYLVLQRGMSTLTTVVAGCFRSSSEPCA